MRNSHTSTKLLSACILGTYFIFISVMSISAVSKQMPCIAAGQDRSFQQQYHRDLPQAHQTLRLPFSRLPITVKVIIAITNSKERKNTQSPITAVLSIFKSMHRFQVTFRTKIIVTMQLMDIAAGVFWCKCHGVNGCPLVCQITEFSFLFLGYMSRFIFCCFLLCQ